jgi:hypothetical protein
MKFDYIMFTGKKNTSPLLSPLLAKERGKPLSGRGEVQWEIRFS